MSNYIGYTPDLILNALSDKFFYGMRRTDEGELFLTKVDLSKKDAAININNPGDPEENYPNFQSGQNFYEGRDINHDIVYNNLNNEQFLWEDSNIFFYVNSEGELVARFNEAYTYDNTVSSNG